MRTYHLIRTIFAASFLFAAAGASALDLSSFSNKDQVTSLKQALTQGAETAVKNLAKENGYLGNDKVRIPLPDSLQKVDGAPRRFGMGKYADELVTSMNRVMFTSYVPMQAQPNFYLGLILFAVGALILTGGDD